MAIDADFARSAASEYAGYAARKFALQAGELANSQQKTANDFVGTQAQAGLTNAQTGQVAANSAVDRTYKSSLAALYGRQGNLAGAQATAVDKLNQGAYAGAGGAGTTPANGSTRTGVGGTPGGIATAGQTIDTATKIPSDLGALSSLPSYTNTLSQGGSQLIHNNSLPHFVPGPYDDEMAHFAGGTSRVPGKGDGKTDKVHTMLAPGEAVLNKAAAEKLGRKKIAAMNKEGVKKMGLPPTDKPAVQKGMAMQAPLVAPPGYSHGIAYVPAPIYHDGGALAIAAPTVQEVQKLARGSANVRRKPPKNTMGGYGDSGGIMPAMGMMGGGMAAPQGLRRGSANVQPAAEMSPSDKAKMMLQSLMQQDPEQQPQMRMGAA